MEVTEGLLIEDVESVINKMNTLASLGVYFLIDDVGTGYSLFTYIKQLLIYELKIDKSFVQDVIDDPNNAAIVKAILLWQSILNSKW
ncbi:hypothetical protein TKV_c18790 [Thermoanaerobacter kivui]|uniref:EAL domain-containing protein n=1 Tax=Thermoanaerobacter kivui TaxID=2325 RepID=A0A097AT97_THEKI|nr:hypothetical protein TKV_c18790 [Thermoanaerobacter kivui]